MTYFNRNVEASKVCDDTDTKYFGSEFTGKWGNTDYHGGFYKFIGDNTALGGDDPNVWNAVAADRQEVAAFLPQPERLHLF